MKKSIFIALMAVIGSFILIISSTPNYEAVAGDGCYICRSESKDSSGKRIHYCRYGSSDTSDARKRCKSLGCVIGGTASCPTAANYNVL